MIQLLGFQRFLILVILAGVTIALAVANFYIFGPQASRAKSQLGGIQSEESTLRQEIEVMKGDQTKFNEQKNLYAALEQKGFFGGQDRVLAREVINQMQKASKVVSVKYEIRSASMKDVEGITDAEYGVLNSPIELSIEAIDDVDIYRFIYMLTYIFPGKVVLDKLQVDRPQRLTTDMLRTIGSGTPLPLVRATMSGEWVTIAPKSLLREAPKEEGEAQ